ncbi:O-antigen ligase family protein [Leptolyngbya sp. Cla-17]|uniref:O-antigen ligase family protein n=1 Tax=Leptolyngbya sp. Cla-17 TaxID=2803751 RepID=UPI001F5C549F|nr:O-antigen ligase family protein [Leptolyngbya sp. Cla-17]
MLRHRLKKLPSFQVHPDPSMRFAWMLVQGGLLVLPFSALFGCVGMIVAAIAIWRQRFSQIMTSRINQGFSLLAVLMVLSAAVAQHRGDAFLGLFNFVPYLFCFAGLSPLIQTPAQLRRLGWVLVVPSVLVCLIGYFQMLMCWLGYQQFLHIQVLWIVIDWQYDLKGTPPGRMSAVLTYANVLASYLVMTFGLGLGFWIEAIRRSRRLGISVWNQETAAWVGLLLLNVGALILTNSRNAWAIAAGACLAFSIYVGWRWLIAGVGLVVGAILAAAFGPTSLQQPLRTIIPTFFWARVTDELYPNRPVPTLRTTQWEFAWSLMQQRPGLGWGLRNFTPLYQAQTGFILGHPHNLPLMLLAEVGIPTTILFLGLVGWVVAQGIQYWRVFPDQLKESGQHETSDRLIYFSFLVAFCSIAIFSLFDVTLFDARVNIMGWMLLIGIWGIANAEKTTSEV